MRILFVTPYLPSPPRFGGQRRLDGLMRELSQNHEVSVLSFNKRDPYERLSVDASESYCKNVITVFDEDLEDKPAKKRLLQLGSMLLPMSFERLWVQLAHDFQKRLSNELSANRYDVVQIEFAQMGAFNYSNGGGQRPVLVLDEHNIEYDLQRRSASSEGSTVRRMYNAVNWRKLSTEEQRVWKKCDGVVVTSPRDHDLLRNMDPTANLRIVPNGVDVQAFTPAEGEVEPDRLLFFGAINYFPNQDGVIHFLDDIFPLIRKARPNTKLWIVGPGARKPVLDRQTQNVEITGFVDDLNEYLDRAAVVVVPLRVGGGTRLKIVEAMAKGKAIVTTRIGAEGLNLVHEKHALLADTPEEFAAQVERLLGNPDLTAAIGREARKLAEERFSWQAVAQVLQGFYDQLALRA